MHICEHSKYKTASFSELFWYLSQTKNIHYSWEETWYSFYSVIQFSEMKMNILGKHDWHRHQHSSKDSHVHKIN